MTISSVKDHVTGLAVRVPAAVNTAARLIASSSTIAYCLHYTGRPALNENFYCQESDREVKKHRINVKQQKTTATRQQAVREAAQYASPLYVAAQLYPIHACGAQRPLRHEYSLSTGSGSHWL